MQGCSAGREEYRLQICLSFEEGPSELKIEKGVQLFIFL